MYTNIILELGLWGLSVHSQSGLLVPCGVIIFPFVRSKIWNVKLTCPLEWSIPFFVYCYCIVFCKFFSARSFNYIKTVSNSFILFLEFTTSFGIWFKIWTTNSMRMLVIHTFFICWYFDSCLLKLLFLCIIDVLY